MYWRLPQPGWSSAPDFPLNLPGETGPPPTPSFFLQSWASLMFLPLCPQGPEVHCSPSLLLPVPAGWTNKGWLEQDLVHLLPIPALPAGPTPVSTLRPGLPRLMSCSQNPDNHLPRPVPSCFVPLPPRLLVHLIQSPWVPTLDLVNSLLVS